MKLIAGSPLYEGALRLHTCQGLVVAVIFVIQSTLRKEIIFNLGGRVTLTNKMLRCPSSLYYLFFCERESGTMYLATTLSQKCFAHHLYLSSTLPGSIREVLEIDLKSGRQQASLYFRGFFLNLDSTVHRSSVLYRKS